MEEIIGSILVWIAMLTPPVAFVLFLILAIRQYKKIAKEKIGKAGAVVFTVLSSYFLTGTIAEIALISWLSYGVAHM